LKGLFPRIFLSFWIASTLIGAAFVIIQAGANPKMRIERRRNLVRAAVRLEAAEAVEGLARGAEPDGRLARFRERTDATIYLFDDTGRTVGPKEPPAPVRDLARMVRREGDREVERDSAALIGFRVPDSSYVAVGRVRRIGAWERALGVETLGQRLLVIVLFSGLVAFLLARYLTRPLRTLRRATRRIAEGDLSARVAPEIGRTDSEIGALGRDFDAMATRVEELVEAQRRLLSDVSHELNSPIARLRVALELARQRAGEDAAAPLDRIEREAERLGVLVAEILALSRLESDAAIERAPLDLSALVDEVVRDADFEAEAAGKRVEVRETEPAQTEGDEEILRRAIENVARNAVRFAPEGTAVEVTLARAEDETIIRVRDHGPGVPEEHLRAIFEPLHRVQPDRDRKTGGAGLGLAIAERAVRRHGGTIDAANASDGGLVVTIRLPAARRG
jgi:two-component system sensor histidine kinase CpxA